jgi:outer membrane protein, adhesin transport system
LTRQDVGNVPNLDSQDDNADVSHSCPLEAPQLYLVNKEALNARASEILSLSSTQAAATTTKVIAPATAAIASPTTSDAKTVSRTAVLAALKGWRDTWIAMKPEAYFEFYAAKYTSRESWKTARRARLLGAQKISLELSDIKIVMQDAKHATSSFQQDYRSSSYQDVLQKTLYWEELNGKWQIVNETVDGPPHARQW